MARSIVVLLGVWMTGCTPTPGPDGTMPEITEADPYGGSLRGCPQLRYYDGDGDGFGDEALGAQLVSTCPAAPPAEWIAQGGDCDDTDPAISPNGSEGATCDGLDNDCNGERDDGLACLVGANCVQLPYQGSTYLACEQNQNWSNAAAACASVGYHLPVISSLGENAHLSSMTSGDAWMGMEDPNSDGIYTWFDGSPTTYTNWNGGEPSGTGQCGRIRNDGRWSDATCTNTYDFTCEASCPSQWFPDTDGDGAGDPTGVPVAGCTAPAGYAANTRDCDDTDATVWAGAPEQCDGIDNNCDGEIDEDPTWYPDGDGDGYGVLAGALTAACAAPPSGHVTQPDDCDDLNATVNPGATETCNGIDDDCDGTRDDGVTCLASSCSAFSLGNSAYLVCTDSESWANADTLCTSVGYHLATIDDANESYQLSLALQASSWIGASDQAVEGLWVWTDGTPLTYQAWDSGEPNGGTGESCAELRTNALWNDQTCGNTRDFVCEADCEASSWWPDTDGDGFGDPASPVFSGCLPPAGYVGDNTDCDDADANSYPDAPELCDGEDNDCDTVSDEEGVWFEDADNDSYGNPEVSTSAPCGAPPAGFTDNPDDCDDLNAAIPGLEGATPDGIDNDCNGQRDDGTTLPPYACTQNWFGDSGYLLCTNNQVWANAEGICESYGYHLATVDDASEDGFLNTWAGTGVWIGLSDPGGTGAYAWWDGSTPTYYNWQSGDPGGNGNCAELQSAGWNDIGCGNTRDFVCEADCPGSVWYPDNDGDGHGDENGTPTAGCLPPGSAYAATADDCDDTDPLTYTGALESCDTVDNDCDGQTDEDPAWFWDPDGDGYGDAITVATGTCASGPPGYVNLPGDCLEGDPNVNPDAAEICDGLDNDCNGLPDDGIFCEPSGGGCSEYTFGGSRYVACTNNIQWGEARLECASIGYHLATIDDASEDGFIDNTLNSDVWLGLVHDGTEWTWDDGTPMVYTNWTNDDPGRPCGRYRRGAGWEARDCDNINEYVCEADCGVTWYADNDGDGFGNPDGATVRSCTRPAGYIGNDSDCDDTDATVNPTAIEQALDLFDQDCDGEDLCYFDGDGDGDGDGVVASFPLAQCAATNTDCDDTDPNSYDGAPEACDNVDNDCDGTADNNPSWFADFDADGYGDPMLPVPADCAQAPPGGYVVDATDCNDTATDINPGATETCDAQDNDCNGLVDDGCGGTYGCTGDTYDGRTYLFCNTANLDWNAAQQYCQGYGGDLVSVADADESAFVQAHTILGSYWIGLNDQDNEDVFVWSDGTASTYRDWDPNWSNAGARDCVYTTLSGWDVSNCGNSFSGLVCETDACTPRLWFDDRDGDGFGDPATAVSACVAPPGAVANLGDCDDSRASVYPGSTSPELPADGIDRNCDGMEACYVDSDGDGYGTATLTTGDLDCAGGGVADNPHDCDDTNTEKHLNEICGDGIDNDCDGTIDAGAALFFADADGDGYGLPGSGITADCASGAPPGYVQGPGTDCDDADATANPGTVEVCDAVDNDCNGLRDDGDVCDTGANCFTDHFEGHTYVFCQTGTTWLNARNACNALPGNYHLVTINGDGAAGAEGGENTWVQRRAGQAWLGLNDRSVEGNYVWYLGSSTFTEWQTGAPNNGGGLVEEDCIAYHSAANNNNWQDVSCTLTRDYVCESECAGGTWYQDADGDGYGNDATASGCPASPEGWVDIGGDCDDTDRRLNPGQAEVCADGLDNDCDGVTDTEGYWYSDEDGDGFGRGATPVWAPTCAAVSGLVGDAYDCDDDNADMNPAAVETCNGLDDDCSGQVDDGAGTCAPGTCTRESRDGHTYLFCTDDLSWYAARDACESVGYHLITIEDSEEDGWAWTRADDYAGMGANDFGAWIGLNELLGEDDWQWLNGDDAAYQRWVAGQPGDDKGDEDCAYINYGGDAWTDDLCTAPKDYICELDCEDRTWYRDADGDGFGDPGASYQGCPSEGLVANHADCDDANPARFPAAEEVCDGVDNDCDGTVDDGVVWYWDPDGDGFGDDEAGMVVDCASPPGSYTAQGGDCVEGDASISPAGTEICDGIDNDCVAGIDNGLSCDTGDSCTQVTYDTSTYLVCNNRVWQTEAVIGCQSLGYELATVDDQAENDFIHNQIGDHSWIGYVDPDADGTYEWMDGTPNGFENWAQIPTDSCVYLRRTNGEWETRTCTGDNRDYICEANACNRTWWADNDGDGYGDANDAVQACERPANYIGNPDDCDDTDAGTNPAATEITADLIDNNCDGFDLCYTDGDGDGYGGGSLVLEVPANCAALAGDCNDSNNAVNPGATELAGNSTDEDCNDFADCYVDADNDGFGLTTVAVDALVAINGTSAGCDNATNDGLADNSTDCDDALVSVYPGAPELCDGEDNDCDTDVDEGVSETYFLDDDGDGFGTPSTTILGCGVPSGYSVNSDDCNDGSASVSPNGIEVAGNTIDEDCNDFVDCYVDNDDDGVGSSTAAADALAATNGASATSCGDSLGDGIDDQTTDCNDSDANTLPGGTEVAGNDIDEDCNNSVDCFVDNDDDGHGISSVDPDSYAAANGIATTTCGSSTSDKLAATADDCDDTDAGISPSNTEQAGNPLDEDCNDFVDCYEDLDNDGVGSSVVDTDSYAATGGVAQTACNVSTSDGLDDQAADCNDTDPGITTGGTEVAGNLGDEDCNGFIDCYEDLDSDGQGSATVATDVIAALNGVGTAACGADDNDTWDDGTTDCNDDDPDTYVGAIEVAGNEIDEDCNGFVDCYRDGDNDGWGTADVAADAAAASEGLATTTCDASLADGIDDDTTDCNDFDGATHPGGTEVAGNLGDEDCSGFAACYVDSDGDDQGSSAIVDTAVAATDGTATAPGCAASGNGFDDEGTDCNDSDPNTYTGAVEVTGNDIDEDCNSYVDCWLDADNDGVGTDTVAVDATAATAGAATLGCAFADNDGFDNSDNDCNDSDATALPGGTEVAGNTIDEDCNGFTDCYADLDDDGYGDALVTDAITATDGVGAACDAGLTDQLDDDNTDCNDSNGLQNPGATEDVCDLLDNNCNGTADEGRQNADNDPADECSDCDDNDAANYPSNTEICDGQDNDCNAAVDEGVSETYYLDADGDGVGLISQPLVDCGLPSGYALVPGDCDDTNADNYPGNTEVCDDQDNNCDTVIDENLKSTFWLDSDMDGFGRASASIQACTQPVGYIDNDGDCNDSNGNIYPNNPEVCDGLDNDCNGQVDDGVLLTFYLDLDGDQHGNPNQSQLACSAPANHVLLGDDCDDGQAASYPNNPETCDGIDNDCNGQIDDGVLLTFYADFDQDNYGDPNNSQQACTAPAFHVANNTDCNDAEFDANPGEQEVCDGIDNNCDAVVDENVKTTFYLDADRDGFGLDSTTIDACTRPAGYADVGGDCDDSNNATWPSAPEQCDSEDNDCDTEVDEGVIDSDWFLDSDGDGHGDVNTTQRNCAQPSGYVLSSDDCDDADPNNYPGNSEVCDTFDNDCDTVPDDGVTITWYLDDDDDGAGDLNSPFTGCTQPSDHVLDSTDCDDTDPNNFPNNPEVCDTFDNDCDTVADNDVTTTYWLDSDGDGHGDPGMAVEACTLPNGYSDDNIDCDDSIDTVYGGAPEICDTLDNDCDTAIDDADGDIQGQTTWYTDSDGDGYGDPSTARDSCTATSDEVTDNQDCDDTDIDIDPDAPEICDSRDNDCDGDVDDDDSDVSTTNTWYADSDGDSYGDANDSVVSCLPPVGYIADDTDCDDAVTTTNPGASETCNSVDDDCSGTPDDNVGPLWYLDDDGDGYGTSVTFVQQCTQPSGYVDNSGDCVDTDYFVNPGAPEICDGADNDCNGLAEDNAAGSWYLDDDGDGFGDSGTSLISCSQPSGYVLDSTDCDDAVSTTNPAGTEVCNAVDDNCDGTADEGLPIVTWYIDADGDGYGVDTTTVDDCAAPSGYAATDDDCDDNEANTNPGATEICDGDDNDCNGPVDDNVVFQDYFLDADGDGFGDASQVNNNCTALPGYILDDQDCDDSNNQVNPDADEICNGIDDDCNGTTDTDAIDVLTFYDDVDGDGYGDASGPVLACNQPPATSADNTDCDDLDANTYPGAAELCDGLDNDCDSNTNDSTSPVVWWADTDGDGVGDANVTLSQCDAPVGYVPPANGTDCDDADPTAYPGATEVCSDGVDNDCDGTIDTDGVSTNWYADTDGDGWGDPSTAVSTCNPAAGLVDNGDDCDDTDDTVHPGAVEQCNTTDDDCDGLIDDNITTTTWYVDTDGDGFGSTSSATTDCLQPTDGVLLGDDCDDADSNSYPAAPELCDQVDNDCDGTVDEQLTLQTWYPDLDGDGFGDGTDPVDDCFPPTDHVNNDDDCDDNDDNVYEGAPDEWYDGIDSNCDGANDFDQDGDGFEGPDDEGEDCNDLDPDINPDAEDTPYDGFDTNCDGADDFDQDGDGVPGNADGTGEDCDDTDPNVYPGAEELAGGADNDCDGFLEPKVDIYPKGCECSQGGGPTAWWLMPLLAAGLRRRR